MSQDARARLHAIIDAYYDNVDGQYDGQHIDVAISTEDDRAIGDAIDLEVVELVPNWNGNTDGANGIIKPNAVFVNGQRVSGLRDSEFSVDLDPSMVRPVTATMTLFVRNLTVKRRDKPMTDVERVEHANFMDYLTDLDSESK